MLPLWWSVAGLLLAGGQMNLLRTPWQVSTRQSGLLVPGALSDSALARLGGSMSSSATVGYYPWITTDECRRGGGGGQLTSPRARRAAMERTGGELVRGTRGYAGLPSYGRGTAGPPCQRAVLGTPSLW